jgi:hypothetical protein
MAQRFGQVPKAFGDIKPPAKEPVASSTNPEAPPSTSPVSPATPQQAPASNAVRPDTPPNPPPEDAGSNPQPVSSPVDPAGSNAPPPDPLGGPIQPTAQPAGPATENAAQPAASPPAKTIGKKKNSSLRSVTQGSCLPNSTRYSKKKSGRSLGSTPPLLRSTWVPCMKEGLQLMTSMTSMRSYSLGTAR